MEKTQLINILKTFSKKEIKEAQRWLSSPSHNLREDIQRLYAYITQDNNLNNNDLLHKEAAWHAIFPKEKYDDARMRQVIFFLLQCLEDFLSYSQWLEKKGNQPLALVESYRHRKLDKVFLKTIQNIEKEQPDSGDADLYEQRHRLFEERSLFQIKQDRSAALYLQETNDALDIYYIAQKLKYFCNMYSHQRVYKVEYEFSFLTPLIAEIQVRNLLHIPAISIYYYIYHTLIEKENPAHFAALKLDITKHIAAFSENEGRDILLMGINYCIGRTNAGHNAYFKDALELYQLGDTMGILLEDNLISRFTFRNAVSIGTREKAFEWVEYFIDKYKKYLDAKYQDGFVQFNYARLYFEKKDYTLAMKLLAKAEYDDVLIALNAKFMLLKMYYELDEYDVLESHLESMRAYLQRKDVIGYHRNIYKNIVRFARKMLRTNPNSKKEIEALRTEIQTTDPMTDREWFYKQLDKM